MEKKYIFIMVRRMQNNHNGWNTIKNKNGFTLIEMMIVLWFISLLILLAPIHHISNQVELSIAIEQIHQFLLRQQQRAIYEKISIPIEFYRSRIHASNETLDIQNVFIDAKDFSFTAKGTVTHAQTITCTHDKKVRKLIIELGSGTIVKR